MKHLSIVAVVTLLSLCLANRLGAGSRSTTLFAHQPATSAFEVASVKPSDPNASGPLANVPIILPPVGGRFSATNTPLRVLIQTAWLLQDHQLVGGPPWVSSQRFDILANAGQGFTGNSDDIQPMVKALLEDRFKLKWHFETRELPIYALVVARADGRLGHKLKPSTADCSAAEAEMRKRLEAIGKGGVGALARMLPGPGEKIPCAIRPAGGVGAFRGEGQTMAAMSQLLTSLLDRPVQDKTNLAGRYDWELAFDPSILLERAAFRGLVVPPSTQLAPSDNPSLTTALQEQLGLKLELTRAPIQLFVIDSAEMPEAN